MVGDEVGGASALKLACNSWVATVNAGTAQALALASALGVDPARITRVSGVAETEPLEGLAPEAGENRRVSIEIVSGV